MKASGAAIAAGLIGLPRSPAHATDASAFQPLTDYFANADGVAERLGYTDPELSAAYHKHVTMLLSLGYVQIFGTSVESPHWVPYISLYFPWGAPNPDDNYRFVPIDPKGSYRISGIKGTAALAVLTMKTGGAHLGKVSSGKTLGEIDLNAVDADADGHYSFLLSPARSGAGAWHALHPETTQLMSRSRVKSPKQKDGICTIERLDRPAGSAVPAEADITGKFRALTSYALLQNEFLLGYLNKLRSRGAEKGFIFDDQSGVGGLIQQRYLMHLFSLAPDEVLLLESDVPETIRYWSVQLFDPHFSAVDFVGHQSTFNDEQVHIDADGRVRFVVASRDPGVPNWLDMAGWPKGGLLWRWNNANRYPLPTVKRLNRHDLWAALPRDTPKIDAAERRAALSVRSAFYQTRGS